MKPYRQFMMELNPELMSTLCK